MPWNDGLIGPALRVAANRNSPLRVVAGPGTGKTFALMRRAARLIEEGTNPRRILVCTFTRTAADDLSREILNLGVTGANNIVAGTLHAFCFRFLAREDAFSDTGRFPRPLLDFETRFMLEDLKQQGLGGIRECRKRLDAFNAAWARLQSEEPGWPQEISDRRFHQILVNWLVFHRCMLVGELIPEAYHYLRNNPTCPERVTFDHVLVDEYQDLNKAEQTILDLLSGNGTLTVVGDEDQSIYSFKYAHPEGIAEFSQYHNNTFDETLLECRRCPQLVVDIANDLISHNLSRSPRTLTCLDENPEGEVYIVQWNSLQEEANGIAQFVNNRVNSGQVDPGKVLILAPRRQLGYAVRDALNDLGTHSHSFFNEEVFDGMPQNLQESMTQQAFTLLTLLANPEDIVALRCWCGYGSNTLRSGSWSRIHNYCVTNDLSPKQVLEQLSTNSLRIANTNQIIMRFRDLQNQLQQLQNLQGQELIDSIFPEEDWASKLRGYAQIDEEDTCDAQALLERLKTKIIQPELPTDVEYVRVMSLHKSKGLTGDMVIVLGCIAGMIRGVIPQDVNPADQQRFIEEQRRLFFVALTRTRQTLILSGVSSLPRDMAHRMRVPVRGGDATYARTRASMFISEIESSAPHPIDRQSFLNTLSGE
jgi:DNA helicase-2/ATP-dependent DNA helicase PcrA